MKISQLPVVRFLGGLAEKVYQGVLCDFPAVVGCEHGGDYGWWLRDVCHYLAINSSREDFDISRDLCLPKGMKRRVPMLHPQDFPYTL